MERRPVKTAKYILGSLAASTFVAVFIFWSMAIWSGDERWSDMAFMAVFPGILLSTFTALVWIEE